jgi:hypothetical protein
MPLMSNVRPQTCESRLSEAGLSALYCSPRVGILASNIDPALLCFKKCDIPRLIAVLFGPSFFRNATGLMFVVLGLLFLVSATRKMRRRGS